MNKRNFLSFQDFRLPDSNNAWFQKIFYPKIRGTGIVVGISFRQKPITQISLYEEIDRLSFQKSSNRFQDKLVGKRKNRRNFIP